jgi:hypothetical protein
MKNGSPAGDTFLPVCIFNFPFVIFNSPSFALRYRRFASAHLDPFGFPDGDAIDRQRGNLLKSLHLARGEPPQPPDRQQGEEGHGGRVRHDAETD